MSTFTLKILALIFMVLDHIGLYFAGAPIILRYIGRLSYPLFLFCMVWGYHYTHNRKIYLLRLYLMSIFMSVLVYFVDSRFPTATGFGNHNIFLSMLLVGVLISAIELYQSDHKKGAMLLCAIFLVQVLYWVIPAIIPFTRSLSGDILTGFIPNLVLNEYGFEFVVLGVLMYFFKEKRDVLCVLYILFCLSQFSVDMLGFGYPMQSMMIAALPFMLWYNGQKGAGMKYFFYVFYPAHALLLFYLANFAFHSGHRFAA